MTKQHCPEQPNISGLSQRYTQYQDESDEEFLHRQFQQSIEALERVEALAPGEFNKLIELPVHTAEEFQQRASHHERIARQAFLAAQRGLLSEEEFNVWSGRRKENGQPVKFRFERAYSHACTPVISCMRGALTGIVRTYVRLQDEAINSLMNQAQNATSAQALFEVEKDALQYGFLDFELYSNGDVAGWPCFPRSTGRFRGATRLRQFFEQRQSELSMSKELAEAVLIYIQGKPYQFTDQPTQAVHEEQLEYTLQNDDPAPFKRLFARLSQIFR